MLALLRRGRFSSALLWPTVLSFVLFLHVAAVTLLAGAEALPLKASVGRLDHYFRPVSILLICGVALYRAPAATVARSLNLAAVTLVFLAAANAIVQICSIFYDVSAVVAPFHPDPGVGGITVAEAAASVWRLVGTFNQPLEHGTVYSVALLAAVHLWRTRFVPMVILLLGVILVFVGGVLAVSKLFLIGGVPLAFLLLALHGYQMRSLLIAVGIAAIASTAASSVVGTWNGVVSLQTMVHALRNREGLVYMFTGGRFGAATEFEKPYQVERAAEAFRESPLLGVGISGTPGLGDNEYLMALAEGGLVALVLVIVRMVVVFGPSLATLRYSESGRLLLTVALVALGGGMGGPVSGIPRAGTVLWTFTSLLLLSISAERVAVRKMVHVTPASIGFAPAPSG